MLKKGFPVFLCFAFLVSLMGCGGNAPAGDEQTREKPDVPSEPETFQDFIKRFNQDEAFHVDRVVFPLLVESLDGDLNPTKSQLKPSSYRFRQIALARTASFDVSQEVSETRAVISYTGKENGIQVSYHFEQKEGEWYLIKIEDLST